MGVYGIVYVYNLYVLTIPKVDVNYLPNTRILWMQHYEMEYSALALCGGHSQTLWRAPRANHSVRTSRDAQPLLVAVAPF